MDPNYKPNDLDKAKLESLKIAEHKSRVRDSLFRCLNPSLGGVPINETPISPYLQALFDRKK